MLRSLLSWLFIAISIIIAAQSLASPVTYTIDPSQSTLSATGALSGNTPSAQTFGSNITSYTGTISADRASTSIQFTAGSSIDANLQPSQQRPDIGGDDGKAPADYGWVAPGSFGATVYAAFRDLIFDLSSDPLTLAANGNFDRAFDIIYSSGGVDWNSGFQFDSQNFSGSDLFNQSPNTPNLSVANGIETLTLPVRFSKIFSVTTTGDSTLRLSGTLVATRSLSNNPPQWKTDGGGSWNDPTNWDGGIPNSATSVARFLGALSAPNAPAIVTLDGDHTVGALEFDNPNTYEIAQGSAGTLSLGDAQNFATISVATGAHRISAPLTLAANTTASLQSNTSLHFSGPFRIAGNQQFTVSGPGLLTISGPQNHGDGAILLVANGQLHLDSNAGFPGGGPAAPHAPLALHIAGPASAVVLGADQDLSDLSVDYASDDIQSLDLNSPQNAGAYRAVRIYGPTDINAKQNLFAAIANARSNPNDGIFDSGLSAHPSSALGIAAISDTRTGANYILIRPTLIGDINLDGVVTIADFIDLASNFGHSGPDITWQEGDLNYDNAVTIADFIDLAANFGNSYAGNVIPISDADMAILNTFAAAHGVTPVPEPATFAFLIAGILLAISRRSASRLTNILWLNQPHVALWIRPQQLAAV